MCISVCVLLRLVAELGETWPYVVTRQPSLLVSVWLWWGYGPSFDLIHVLIPCLSVALHMARCCWGVTETLQLTVPSGLNCHFNKSEDCERGRRINTSKQTKRSEVTSITYFWRLVYHDYICVHASLCVCVCVQEYVCAFVCLCVYLLTRNCLWGESSV